jgi:2-oxoisovalerate dehydrogenase E2 component (dihydrolipoyl transacylase)
MSSALLCRTGRSSSSLIRSTAAFIPGGHCRLQRGSPRSMSFLVDQAQRGRAHQSMSVIESNASYHLRNQANQISTSAPCQKSAMPLSTIDRDDDDTAPASASSTNSTPFLLADIGEGISEVELLQWFVNSGDTVAQFDRICEVQSDKAAVEITSRFDGTIEMLCGEVGDMMFVGKPLLYIATENDAGAGLAGQPQLDQQAQQMILHNVYDEQDRLSIPSVGAKFPNYYDPTSGDENSAEKSVGHGEARSAKVLTSPAVRKLSKENNINLRTVLGTGPGGRILKSDILKLIEPNVSVAASLANAQEKKFGPTFHVASTSGTVLEEDTVMPIRGYNRLMVKSMTASLQIPHMVYSDEINVNALTTVRDSLRPLAKEMGVHKLTYLPFFIKAASLAMNTYPVLNSTIDAEKMELTYHKSHNVGVAVDTERGLAVPVVKGCQDKSVLEIAMELNRLYALAMEGNLSEEDISGCTFTLSNIGAIGGTYMSPVVLPPQVAIGAMGKIQRLPRFVSDDSDEVESARIMPISWGGDHRAVDGATMARFSNVWKSYCENPSSMMFAMR